jgi:hypothetical protein
VRDHSAMRDDSVGWWEFDSPTVGPSQTWSLSFAALVSLMIHGPAREDRVRGVIAAKINEPKVTVFRYRIARRGPLVRCETPEGRIHFIAGLETVWLRDPAASGVVALPRRRGVNPAPDDHDFGTARPTEDRWQGDDFTIPTGPEAAVTFLGRPAWEVELAPPPHKPYPLKIVIDAETGLVLRQANDAFRHVP